jgi:hypothetical protein
MVKIVISLTTEDITNLAYATWMAPFSKPLRIKFLSNIIVTSFLGALACIGFISITNDTLPTSGFLLIILPVICIAITLYYWLSVKKRFTFAAQRMYSNRENYNTLLKTELTFSNEGIETVNFVDTTKQKWAAIVKVVENERYYFLFLNSINAHIIPKKEIPADQLADFRRLLTENIPGQYYFTQKQ